MSSYLSDIDRERVPAHVAIVMDGNGRWAQQRGLPRTDGHGAGEEALFDTVKGGRRGRPSLDDRVRVQHGELEAPGRRGAVPHELQPRGSCSATATSCTRIERAHPVHGPAGTGACRARSPGRWRPRRTSRATPPDDVHHRVQLRRAGGDRGRGPADRAGARRGGAGQGTPTRARHLLPPVRRGDARPGPVDPNRRAKSGSRTSCCRSAAYAELWFTPMFWPDFSREDLVRGDPGLPEAQPALRRGPVRGRLSLSSAGRTRTIPRAA